MRGSIQLLQLKDLQKISYPTLLFLPFLTQFLSYELGSPSIQELLFLIL